MIFRQRVTGMTQCAGQACIERKGCGRFENRVQNAHWASFDLERLQHDDPCVHRIVFTIKEAA